MIVIRFRSCRLIVNVSMLGQDGIPHPAPLGTFPLSYNGDILIKFRHLSKHSSWHPGENVILILGAIHLLLVGCAYFLAVKSRQNGTGMSPLGLAIGFGLAYAAGFLIFDFL
jgi:hypothetical protein